MKADPALLHDLELLGLSLEQAEIYLLLVTHKELRIQEIVALARMPRSSVYACLERLYELGIAEEIVDEHFKKIRPYAIDILRHDLDERLAGFQRVKQDLQRLEDAIVTRPASSPDAVEVRYYKGRSGARQLLWNTLKADGTVYVYSEWGRGRYVGMKFYENFVAESNKRSVKEKVLINPKPHALESIKAYNVAGSRISRTRLEDIRVLDEDTMAIKGETFIYNGTYSQVYLKDAGMNGFEIESRHFINTQRSIFETLWHAAKPVSTFL